MYGNIQTHGKAVINRYTTVKSSTNNDVQVDITWPCKFEKNICRWLQNLLSSFLEIIFHMIKKIFFHVHKHMHKLT